ncbi:MAG: SGNH/GDSL hydrolase family protein [Geodermatophilaceae bacterium]|nr:SGNH/GDSL hydrolase family protein [Geodermatophilaceae bacterium]
MDGLVAYGHSWVQGDGASRPERAFVDVAARELGVVATNLGVGGTASADVHSRLRGEPAPVSRQYLVMTGLNDARLHGASPEALESYAVALLAIFRAFHGANPAGRTVAVEQPHLIDYSLYPPHNRGSDAVVDAFNVRLRAVASTSPWVVLATVSGWNPTTMLSADTVHPNDAGHRELARAVIDAVELSSASP